MARWATILLTAADLGAVALWTMRRRQQRQSASLVAELRQSAAIAAIDPGAGQADLPAPVARYLAHVLPADRRPIKTAAYRQVGRLRSDPRSQRWLAFTACQLIAPAAVGFVWEAAVSLLPFVRLQVRDSLHCGRGAGAVRLWSAVPVGSAGGNPEMNSGALHRFLAEAVWFPTALLPSRFLRWEPIDDLRAMATLEQGDVCVSLEFRFDHHNEVVGIFTPGRWGSFDGGYRKLAWEGRFSDYRRRGGMLVPDRGEVGWYIDGRWEKVWQGRVVDAEFEFA
ncbi:DUF6920 family protein [Piscinibacter sakaiensis]|uniref:DUF6920 family protein n=1 Tax=Piscinibacter sakaiensis TaxID=1547922 RepID=UPI003AAE10EB